MALTRIDCHFFRGALANSDTSSFVGINPDKKPGSLVVAGACAVREGIGSQVACKLSLEHFLDGVLNYFGEGGTKGDESSPPEVSLQVLEAAFRDANSAVYDFGLKLAAGGRMSASLLGLVVEDAVVAAARVGRGSAFLLRGGELFPFFEGPGADRRVDDPALGLYIGAQSLVSVELASVPLQSGDVLLLFSEDIDDEGARAIVSRSPQIDFIAPSASEEVSQAALPDPERLAFGISAMIGPDAIYLDRPLDEDL